MIALLPTAGVLLLGLLLLRERRAAAARAELVARACHEVRGPLGAAHLALHTLTRRGVPTRAVEDELWRAARAVADLAAAPGGERALDTPEAVDLAALLRRQTESWAGAARARGCELILRAPAEALFVRGDRLRLAQATANLVGNALEHGGGRIEVRLTAVGERIAMEVRDEGPGLPATLPTLVGRARGGRGSRGRGLAIASEIAERHGGCVATAPAASGARIVLELPALRPDALEKAPAR